MLSARDGFQNRGEERFGHQEKKKKKLRKYPELYNLNTIKQPKTLRHPSICCFSVNEKGKLVNGNKFHVNILISEVS